MPRKISPKEDAAARTARAKQLHAEIDDLINPEPDLAKAAPPEEESPRDFVQRRMQELSATPKKSTKKPKK